MGAYHAVLSPSGAAAWTVCTAKPGAERGKPNPSSDASRHGTAGHQIGEDCLREYLAGREFDTNTFVGRVMGYMADGSSDWIDRLPAGVATTHTLEVDQELADAANTYARYVIQLHQTVGGELLIEQKVGIGWITGEEGATGSSDAIILAPDGTIYVVDAKFGRGKVYAYEIVEPETLDVLTGETVPPKRRVNVQLGMYALGAWHEHSAFVEIKRVVAIIVQPFLNSVSQYECPVDELLELGKWLSSRADETRENPQFVPGNKQCFFCRARFDCHARNAAMLESSLEGFEDAEEFKAAKPLPIFLPNVGQLWTKIEAIRSWCDDIETKVKAELTVGNPVLDADGKPLKLVEGRKPHKAWKNETEAQQTMEKFRLGDLMWDKTLISPSKAEKLAATEEKRGKNRKVADDNKPIGPRQWKVLSEMIHQGDGKPVIAKASDPRPAIGSANDMPESDRPADNSDLF